MEKIKKFDLFEDLDINLEEQKIAERINILSNIITKLVKRRIELNISQRELAKMTNIKQPMIARIETMKTIPRIDTLISIAIALDLYIELKSKFDTITTKKAIIIYSTKQDNNIRIDGFNQYKGGNHELYFN